MDRRSIRVLFLIAVLCHLSLGCDERSTSLVDNTSSLDAVHRRIDLRNVPGRHVQVWDAMFALDTERARALLVDHITDDCFITFKLPEVLGGDQTFAPGIEGWINVVTGSAEAGNWVSPAPGYPRSLHVIGSVLIQNETSTTATLRAYVRASHYEETTTVDFSEAILNFDMIYDTPRETWLVAHLDLTPLSLRNEGGEALPPVTAPPET
ncbi:MAG: hypothetical protein AAF355_11675 [Myxococcota bacterium]